MQARASSFSGLYFEAAAAWRRGAWYMVRMHCSNVVRMRNRYRDTASHVEEWV